jgi:hypothetical protein
MAPFLQTARTWLRLCLAICATLPLTGHAAAPTFVVHNEPHLKHAYALLEAALHASGMAAHLVDAPQSNYRRALYQITQGDTHIDMATASQARLRLVQEGKLRLIPIPLDRGLLGWRINLLLRKDIDKLAPVKDAAALRKFTVGQHVGWPNIEIYRYADIPTKEIKKWSHGEFSEQLEAGFIDVFPLGLEETISYFLPLFQQHYPQVVADPHLLVRYPWFRFVWVSAGPDTDALYAVLQRGFDTIAANGDFLRIWNRYRSAPAADIYRQRTIIELPNPFFDPSIVPPRYQHLLISPETP